MPEHSITTERLPSEIVNPATRKLWAQRLAKTRDSENEIINWRIEYGQNEIERNRETTAAARETTAAARTRTIQAIIDVYEAFINIPSQRWLSTLLEMKQLVADREESLTADIFAKIDAEVAKYPHWVENKTE